MSWSFLKITSSSKNAYFWLWRPPKVTKKCKNRLIFFSSCMGYGVRKMTARWWGVFLDIRTSRQNAYFFIFWGFKGQKGSKKAKNGHYFLFFFYGDMGCSKWPHGGGDYFWISWRSAKMLIYLFMRAFRVKRGSKRFKNHQKKCFLFMKQGVSNRLVIWLGWFLIITASF